MDTSPPFVGGQVQFLVLQYDTHSLSYSASTWWTISMHLNVDPVVLKSKFRSSMTIFHYTNVRVYIALE